MKYRVMSVCNIRVSQGSQHYYIQGCTNTGQLELVLWRLFEASAWNLIHANRLALRILRWILHFWKICEPLNITVSCINVVEKSVFPVSPRGPKRQYPKYIMKFTTYTFLPFI
jgi:hypothetical protein